MYDNCSLSRTGLSPVFEWCDLLIQYVTYRPKLPTPNSCVRVAAISLQHQHRLVNCDGGSTGVFGQQGRGLVSALNLEAHPALLASMHSFGKAFGAHGAVVVGSATLREFLINYARPLIYSTSLPFHRCARGVPRRVFRVRFISKGVLALSRTTTVGVWLFNFRSREPCLVVKAVMKFCCSSFVLPVRQSWWTRTANLCEKHGTRGGALHSHFVHISSPREAYG